MSGIVGVKLIKGDNGYYVSLFDSLIGFVRKVPTESSRDWWEAEWRYGPDEFRPMDGDGYRLRRDAVAVLYHRALS